MSAAASFRARRPASPPLGASYPPAPVHSQRFPHPASEHMDADERRASASKGSSLRTKGHPPGGIRLSSGEWKLLLAVIIIAAGVRMFKLSHPTSVVFDEVHFGKFASKYIKTRYYVDVHPPLAKLLITLAAFVSGYDGNFDFKEIGKPYENVPYVAMRMLPATLGLGLVPLTYLTLRAMDCRATTALIGALFVTFENGLITQSRHILLDSPLVFFTGLTTFFWVGFSNEDKHKPFTEQWWIWLTLTGLSLGAVVSCKWVGLFTIATIGLATIRQLWLLLGDLRVSPRLWVKHFLARALCLIVVPTLFYMAMFAIHFAILENSGDGDGFMSSEFQHTLGGRGMQDTFADIAFGSEITLRHVNTQGGYLHSHAHNYPVGSKQQQITLYPHRDSNNNWRVANITWTSATEPDHSQEPLEFIRPFMHIRLLHTTTGKRLHSHDVRPPVSEVDFQNEVSGYGSHDHEGDGNDNWIVELEHGAKEDPESWKRLRTLRTHFRLRHSLQGCYLFSHKVKLPEWGYEQQEVTCNKNAVKANSLWYIETAKHPNLPVDAEKVNYRRPGFLGKFLELQKVMWVTNAGLTDRHVFDSRPHSWPRLRRGINFWVKDHRQIYLMGNPWVWWLSTLAVLSYVAARGLLVLRQQRGFRDFDNTRVVKYDSLCGFLFVGWALHYFPFFLMSRQLFLHHYFPALWFAILLSCGVFDLVTSSLRPRVRLYTAAVLVIVAVYVWSYFSPLAYGGTWTKQQCMNAKWLRTWDFSCNDFPDSLAAYDNIHHSTPQTTAVQSTVVGGEDGVRAAVILKGDAVGDAPEPKKDADTTSILANVPHPGHDVFAEQPVKDINSENRPKPPPVPPAADDKEVSKVVVAPESRMTDPPAVDGGSDVKAEKVEEKLDPAVHGEDKPPGAENPSTATGTAKDSGEEAPAAHAQGPLPHDEAEAELAREDLFPDAV